MFLFGFLSLVKLIRKVLVLLYFPNFSGLEPVCKLHCKSVKLEVPTVRASGDLTRHSVGDERFPGTGTEGIGRHLDSGSHGGVCRHPGKSWRTDRTCQYDAGYTSAP